MAFTTLGDFTDPLATQAIEPSITETTPGEVLGATASEAWNSLPTVRIGQQESLIAKEGAAPEEFDGGLPDMSGGTPRGSMGTVSILGPRMGQPQNVVQPEDAQAQMKQAGLKPDIDTPISDARLQAHIQEQQRQQQSADVISRNGNAIVSGQAARFGVGALTSLLDPLNDAAMMVPAAPEAFVGAKLAGAANAFERTMIRGAAGAVNGAAGMAALEPLNYALTKSEYDDYSAGDALRNIFYGAAMGAAGHMVMGGLFGDHHTPAPDDVDTAMAALKPAIAQVMNDKPVDVAGILDYANASKAADRLEQWHGEQQRIMAEADASRAAPGELPPDRSGAIADHEATLGQLREQAGQMRGEADAAQAQRVVGGMDPETSERLDQINQELGGVIPKARRAGLMQERDMLMDGRGDMDVGSGDPLEQARSAAQVQGLTAAAQRAEASAADVAGKLEALKAQAAQEATAAQAARDSADRSTRIAQARQDARESTLQNLMERDVRKFAGTVGATLEQGEAARIAHEIRTAQPAEAADIIKSHLDALGQRAKNLGPLKAAPRDAVAPSTSGLRAEAQGAAQDMAKKALDNPAEPALQQSIARVKETLADAPEVTGDTTKDLAQATKLEADLKAQVDQATKAGRLKDPDDAAEPAEAKPARNIADIMHEDKVDRDTANQTQHEEKIAYADAQVRADAPAIPAEYRAQLLAADEQIKIGKAAADYGACLAGKGF